MIIRRDAVRLRKCSSCDAHVVDIRNGRDNGIGMPIESSFCQLLKGREVARCEVVMTPGIDAEDENFLSFHALCVASLSNVLAGNFIHLPRKL